MVGGFRGEEERNLTTIAYLRAFSRAYMSAVPALTAVASLATYSSLGGSVRASILFPAIAVFSQLRFPLIFYPMTMAQ